MIVILLGTPARKCVRIKVITGTVGNLCMTKSPFKRKLTGIRYLYGDSAAKYFERHPQCETCGEKRIPCLNVHHEHGKKVDLFKTLCANCHAIYHARSGHFTVEHEKTFEQGKAAISRALKIRNTQIVLAYKQGKSLRQIAGLFGISHVAVFRALKTIAYRPA